MHIHHLIFRQHFQRLKCGLQSPSSTDIRKCDDDFPLTCLGSADTVVCWALLKRGETRTEFLRLPVKGTVLVDAIWVDAMMSTDTAAK